MHNALIFTGLILLAGLAGGLIGSACAKGRKAGDCEGRLAEVEDRLDALADHCMDGAKKLSDRMGSLEDKTNGALEWAGELDERLKEVEFLMGDTPTGGLLGRVGALEEAARKGAQDGR